MTTHGSAGAALLLWCGVAAAQEPSGTATPAPSALSEALSRVTVGGYAEAHLENRGPSTEARLERLVLYLGYRFNDWLRFFSETEVEDASKVEAEQAYLEATPWPRLGVRAGLLLVPVGAVNLRHEPPTFFSVDRPVVEKVVLPSTWREMGVSVFGQVLEGLQYQVGVFSGLQGPGLSVERGLRGGRGEGVEVHTEQPAVAGRLTFDRVLGLEVSGSFYYSGAGQDVAALSATRLGLVEVDGRFHRGGFEARALYARVFIVGAEHLVAVQREADPAAEPLGSAMQAFSAEAGYDVLRLLRGVDQELIPFSRYEYVDTRAALAAVEDAGASRATHFLTLGLCYRPHPQVAVKADYRRTLFAAPGVEEAPDRVMLGVGVSY